MFLCANMCQVGIHSLQQTKTNHKDVFKKKKALFQKNLINHHDSYQVTGLPDSAWCQNTVRQAGPVEKGRYSYQLPATKIFMRLQSNH